MVGRRKKKTAATHLLPPGGKSAVGLRPRETSGNRGVKHALEGHSKPGSLGFAVDGAIIFREKNETRAVNGHAGDVYNFSIVQKHLLR